MKLTACPCQFNGRHVLRPSTVLRVTLTVADEHSLQIFFFPQQKKMTVYNFVAQRDGPHPEVLFT